MAIADGENDNMIYIPLEKDLESRRAVLPRIPRGTLRDSAFDGLDRIVREAELLELGGVPTADLYVAYRHGCTHPLCTGVVHKRMIWSNDEAARHPIKEYRRTEGTS